MTFTAALHAFHFLRPAWLLALLPLTGLLALLWRRRNAQGDGTRLIDRQLLPLLRLAEAEAGRAGTPWPWLGLAWLLAVLALAGPSWQRVEAPGFRAPAAWVLVLDLSPSMAATDIAPNRATRARYAIEDLLDAARDARVALIAFSAEAYTVTPLTDDVATIRALLPPLQPDIMPAAGDALAPALDEARGLLAHADAHQQRVIVLSDGFDDPAAAFAAAQRLRASGAQVDAIGIGTAAGAPLPKAGGGFETGPDGRPALVRLALDRLRALARAGGGGAYTLAEMPGLITGLQAARPEDARRAGKIQVQAWRDAGVWLLPLLLIGSALLWRRGWL